MISPYGKTFSQYNRAPAQLLQERCYKGAKCEYAHIRTSSASNLGFAKGKLRWVWQIPWQTLAVHLAGKCNLLEG